MYVIAYVQSDFCAWVESSVLVTCKVPVAPLFVVVTLSVWLTVTPATSLEQMDVVVQLEAVVVTEHPDAMRTPASASLDVISTMLLGGATQPSPLVTV